MGVTVEKLKNLILKASISVKNSLKKPFFGLTRVGFCAIMDGK